RKSSGVLEHSLRSSMLSPRLLPNAVSSNEVWFFSRKKWQTQSPHAPIAWTLHMTLPISMRPQRLLFLCIAAFVSWGAPPSHAVESGITVAQDGGAVRVTWPISETENGAAVFNMDGEKPLIESLGIATKGGAIKTISAGLNPVTLITVGERDLKKPAGWVA